MPTRWNADVSERLEKVEAVVEEFRGRFDEIGRRFDGIDRRFEAIDLRFEAIDLRFGAVDRRFDELEERLSTKIDVTVEHFDAVVRLTAENYAGVLARIERDLNEFRSEMREQTRQTSLMLASHENRITALERKPRPPRRR